MNKILEFIDKMIEKIPVHIRDIIQKGFLALGALALLIAMIYGVRRGLEDAIPGGAKIHETTEDLFYTEKLRQENMKKQQLIEDIELERDEFQRMDNRIDPDYTQMGRDVTDRMMGEKGELLKKESPFERGEDDAFMDTTTESPKTLPGQEEQPRSQEPQLMEPAVEEMKSGEPSVQPGAGQPSAPAPENLPGEGDLQFQEE